MPQDLGRVPVIVIYLHDVADKLHAVGRNVVQPANKRRDIGRTRLGGEQGLSGGKARVTLTLMPSSRSLRVALSPSMVSGHLTTTLDATLA